MHSVSHGAGRGKCVAKDKKGAAMRRLIGLRSRVHDDGPCGHTAGSLGLPVGIRVAIATREFVGHKATEHGLDKVVSKGTGAAAERIVHLAVVELRVQRLAWSQNQQQGLDGGESPVMFVMYDSRLAPGSHPPSPLTVLFCPSARNGH